MASPLASVCAVQDEVYPFLRPSTPIPWHTFWHMTGAWLMFAWDLVSNPGEKDKYCDGQGLLNWSCRFLLSPHLVREPRNLSSESTAQS